MTENILNQLNIEPKEVTLTFGILNNLPVACSTFNRDNQYYERIYDNSKWNLTNFLIKIHRCSVGKLLMDENISSKRLLLILTFNIYM